MFVLPLQSQAKCIRTGKGQSVRPIEIQNGPENDERYAKMSKEALEICSMQTRKLRMESVVNKVVNYGGNIY